MMKGNNLEATMIATTKRKSAVGALLALTLFMASAIVAIAAAQDTKPAPSTAAISPDGSVQIPSFSVPYSAFASEEAKAAFIAIGGTHTAPPMTDMAAVRSFYAKLAEDGAAKLRARYPVEIEDGRVGGVPVRIVRPVGAQGHNTPRVLICLHGGAFMWGELIEAEVESVAIANASGIDVIGVDYREAPEHPFPAAVDDVLAVYRELLKTHAPQSIGIYGGSAGAILTGETVAALIDRGLPVPGAIGLFNGGIADAMGDSIYWAGPLTGAPTMQPLAVQGAMRALEHPYFSGTNIQSFLAFPASDPARLKGFPPTLLLSGTRDFMLSSVLYSERLLSRAGVPTELHVWDGLWHTSFGHAELPETQEMIRFTAEFFRSHLTAPSRAEGTR
jgi:acetyl esterase/lipase